MMESPYLSYKSRLRFFSNKISPNKYQTQKKRNKYLQTNSDPKFHTMSKTFSHQMQPKSSKFDVRQAAQNISVELVQTIKKKALEEKQKMRITISEAQRINMYPSFVSRMLPTYKHHMEMQNCRSLLKNVNQIQVRKLSTQNSPIVFHQNLSPHISKQGCVNQDSNSDIDRRIEDFDQTFILLGRNSRRQTNNQDQTKRMNLTMDISVKKETTKKSFFRPLKKIQTLGIQRKTNQQEFEAWNDKSFVEEQSIVMFLQSEKVSLNERTLKRKKKLSRSNVD